MLIDTHAHLHVKEFDADRDEVIARAAAANVDWLSVGFEPRGNVQAAKLADLHNKYWTAGIHPHNADECSPETLDHIQELAAAGYGKGIVAIGECGLDYFKNFQPRETQLKAFAEQLILAKQMGLPVIVHCRDAWEDAFEILQRQKIEQAVFHCFSGSQEIATRAWDRGYYTSFTGIITYPSAESLRALIKQAPLDKIMIESDCPYLAPQSHRGQRNEPAFLGEVVQLLAELKRKNREELEIILEKNTKEYFQLS